METPSRPLSQLSDSVLATVETKSAEIAGAIEVAASVARQMLNDVRREQARRTRQAATRVYGSGCRGGY
jgi:heme exporter protein D